MPTRPRPMHERVRARLRDVRVSLSHWRAQRRMSGPKLLRAFAQTNPEASFIVIGANDGLQGDHLAPMVRETRWRGILVEPHPDAFARLQRNFGDLADRLTLENVAITSADGRGSLYEIAPPQDTAEWELLGSYDQLASLSRSTLLAHEFVADREARIGRLEVECLSFESLCRKHRVDRLDLLAIDTEGSDFEILEQVMSSALRPALMIYEHFLFSQEQRERARELISEHGYESFEEAFDTWCLGPTALPAFRSAWQEIGPGPGGMIAAEFSAP